MVRIFFKQFHNVSSVVMAAYAPHLSYKSNLEKFQTHSVDHALRKVFTSTVVFYRALCDDNGMAK